MSKRKGPNRENLEQTRRVFLEIARREFVDVGYSLASTNTIVTTSGMARGSLYYHFGDKFGLFMAVYTDTIADCYESVCREVDKFHNDPERAVLAGCDVFWDFCMRQDFRRIVLFEAQSALNYDDRMELLEQTLLGKLRATLQQLEGSRKLKGYTVNTVMIFLIGILSEVGRSFDTANDIMAQRETCAKALRVTLKGMIG